MATFPPIDIPGTIPENWELLVQMIQAMLPSNVDISSLTITSTGDLVNYLTGDKYVPIYTMREVLTGFAKVSGANPADTTNVAIRPITDIVPVAGGQVVKDIVSGKGSFGTVKKAVILSSLMALFVSTLTPAVSQQDYKAAIMSVIDEYTIDGENVLVYLDENGKSHVSEALMNGVRAALIELGTYDSGDPVINIPSTLTPKYTWGTPLPLYNIESTNHITGNIKNSGKATAFASLECTFDNVTGTAPIHMGVLVWQTAYGEYNADLFLISNASFSGTYHRTRIRNNGKISDEPTISLSSDAATSHGETYYIFRGGTLFIDAVPSKFSSFADAVSSIGANINLIECDSVSSNMTPLEGEYGWLIKYGTISGGGGVEGVDVTGKSDFGDMTKTLEDAVQGLADRYTTLATPTDEDPFHKDKWYELNLNDIDVFEDGLTSDQTDPEDNTQGDVDDDTKDKIIEDLLNLIKNITGTPDLPDIPAGDSGDTPPAEPPVLDGSSNGLWTIYNPSITEVHAFGAWLWSDSIIDQIVRQFNSPIDAIIGFHQIYCTPETGSTKTIKAGYLDSPVTALEVTDQYAEINCGEVSVNEYYGNVLDYDNTQVSVYLPFVGIVPLDTNIVMDSTLEIIYRIDVFTGTCLAQIKVKKQNSNAVMYAFEGNCAVQIPLTATTYTGMVGALISGISAGVSFAAGDMLHAAASGINAAMSAMSGKTGTKQSGSMGSNAGALGIRKPYLIVTRVVSAMPAGFESLAGLPSTELVQLGSLSGFTSIRNVHLEGITGTSEEIEEIKSLLESGVIF